jgi:ketopantoate reductase
MKTLIAGTGITATVLGWAMVRAGMDVDHIILGGNLIAPARVIPLDVLDLRNQPARVQRNTYVPSMVQHVSPEDRYDLIIVGGASTRASAVIAALKDAVPHALFLVLMAPWENAHYAADILPADHFLMGYANISGRFIDGRLSARLDSCLRLGYIDGNAANRLPAMISLLEQAGLQPEVSSSLHHWQWVQQAIYAGIFAVVLREGGFGQSVRDEATRHAMLAAIHDAFGVIARWGVNLSEFPDAVALGAEDGLTTRAVMRLTSLVRKNLDEGRFPVHLDDMRRLVQSILAAGDKVGLDVPALCSTGGTGGTRSASRAVLSA